MKQHYFGSSRFLIFSFQLIALLVFFGSCSYSGKQNDIRQVENIVMPDTIFASPADSIDWLLKNYPATAVERLGLYLQISRYDFEKSRNYTSNHIALIEKEKEELTSAKLHMILGSIYWRYGIRDSAWIYLNKALPVAKRLNDKPLESNILITMGNLAYGEPSIRYFFEALKCHESADAPDTDANKERIRALTGNIAVSYKSIGNLPQAEKYAARLKQMAEEAGDTEKLIQANNLYSDINVQKGNPESALDYAMQSLEMVSDKNLYIYRPYVLQYISYVYLEGLNAGEKALEYGQESLRVAEELGRNNEIVVACNAIANAHYHLGNYSQSEAMALRGLEIDSLSRVADNLILSVTRANIMMGNKEKAMKYLEKYEHYLTSIADEEYQQQLAELDVIYESEKKEFEIERQQHIIERHNLQRGLLTGGIVMCVVVLSLLWYMLRLRTRRNRALAEMNATKDKFFSIISHDLKNPALAQRDALQLLVKNAGSWDANALTEYYHELLKSADGQVELLYNLLNWAQVQTGRMTYTPVTFNLSTRLRSDIALIRKPAENKGVALIVQMPEETLVTGDGNMLATVVRNLLTNAVKFTPKGGTVTLEVQAPSNSPEGGGNFPPSGELRGACISVSDTGIGMNEEQIRNLFRFDSRHSRPGTANEQGSGLGLIVCRELLEKHGSELHIESEEGKGSRFWFELKV